jgi:hypothetical protein
VSTLAFPDVVKIRRLDPDQPLDPSAEVIGDVRYLDTEAAPIVLRCQFRPSRRREQTEQPGGTVEKAVATIRYRRRDILDLDDRTPAGLLPGDLVIAVGKPPEWGAQDADDTIVRYYVDDPVPEPGGFLGPQEFSAVLRDRRPALI